jgi:hypothetical protein
VLSKFSGEELDKLEKEVFVNGIGSIEIWIEQK